MWSAIPIDTPQFAASFLHDTGLKAGTSNDLELLQKTFKFQRALWCSTRPRTSKDSHYRF